MSDQKSIILCITNTGIRLNDQLNIPIENTNLPYGEFRFTEGRDIYWEAEMISYSKTDANLTIRIINYRPAYLDHFLNQKPKAAVLRLTFTDIYWPAFNADLSFYKKTSFLNLLSETMPVTNQTNEKLIHLKVNASFNKVRFGMGFITFDQKLPWLDHTVEIKINNSHILPEFEYIKSYFPNHFNSCTFEVLLVIHKEGKSVNRIIAASKEIEMIKDVAIDTIKFIRLEKLKKPPRFIHEVDKSLFTAPDLFEPFDRNMLGTNPMSQQELFDHIMKTDDIRNKKQLEYLAGNLQSESEKLHFTLTPKIGFLFTIKGDKMVHYIWEMLNTNATYIWSFDPVIWLKNRQLEKIEEVISYIRNHGRDSYLRNVSSKDDILFRRVLHKSAGSQFTDHFPKWKHTVNESIV
ncbi:MAG: hypothetical protein IPM42_11295 [Saprospiraceae bacterium]|nr:hypothetical protein [Saprospiraceae bacterium]